MNLLPFMNPVPHMNTMPLTKTFRPAPLFVALGLLAGSLATAGPAVADTARYRLSWRDDPSTTMVVGWDQTSGSGGVVHYGKTDEGTNASAYPLSQGVDRVTSAFGMENHFVRLNNLEPDTAYYFVIRDDTSTSPRFWFRTAPATPKAFSVVAGGDSRNNRTPRRNGNQVVAKVRPLVVMLGGDFTDDDTATQWRNWFDDWQMSTSPDGRMYPMLATRGNHDSNASIYELWDTPSDRNHYALTFGGTMARLYTLNSEIAAGGNQRAWLDGDLSDHACITFKLAQYHKPMRPHTSGKSEGQDEYTHWSDLFFNHRLDLAVECDSHMVKRTWPLVPATSGDDEGFVRDDDEGTTYIGEGCWGAPTRTPNDSKSWTRAAGSFNQVNWIQVHPDRIEVRTLPTDSIAGADSVSDADPFSVPNNLEVWTPTSGAVVTVPARERPDCGLTPEEVIAFGDTWSFHDQGVDLGPNWAAPDFEDGAWASGPGQLGYGDGDEATVLTDADPNHPSVYFRKAIDLPRPVLAAQLRVLFDDAVAVWVNGARVYDVNMDDGTDFATFASASSSDNEEAQATLDAAGFVVGRNVVAAMVKQRNGSSSDVSFDLSLRVTLAPPPGGTGGAGGNGGGCSYVGAKGRWGWLAALLGLGLMLRRPRRRRDDEGG